MWGSRSSKDLMLSIGSEPGKVVALPQLRLGWRREERSYLGYGGRGGKDHSLCKEWGQVLSCCFILGAGNQGG